MKNLPRLSVALCLAAGLAAQTLARQAATSPAKTAEQPEAASATVTLLEPGSSPRQQLRYTLSKGQSQTMTMNMAMSMSMTMNGTRAPAQTMPEMKTVMTLEVTDVRENGDVVYDAKVTEADVKDDPAANAAAAGQIRQALKSMVGMTGQAQITNRGVTKNVTFTPPPGLNPMMRKQIDSMKNSFRNMCTPFPEEAIGVGAKWKIAAPMTVGGMQLNQIITITLKRIDGKQLELEMDVAQSADPQDVKSPELPPGATLHLASLSSKGSGAMKSRLDRIVPVNSTANVVSDTDMKVAMGPNTQQMVQHLEMKVTIEGADKP